MTVLRALGFAGALAAAAGTAAGQPEGGRAVIPGAPGPNRLAVDVDLLARAAVPGRRALEGLSRLRLSGRAEVPYLLVQPASPARRWRDAALREVARTRRSSGFEADLGGVFLVDRVRLDGLPAPFLKRARLEGSGDRQRWTVLAEQVTLFDLPDERLSLLEAEFARGEYRYLRVVWDDRSSAVMPMPVHVRLRQPLPEHPPSPPRVEIPFDRRPSEPGRSRYRLRLPGPGLPVAAVEVRCAGTHVLRDARVSEARLAGGEVRPAALGSAVLRRAVRGDLVAADLRIPVAPPEGAELDVVVEDGDNPPLEVLGFTLELAVLPWIYFEAPSTDPLAATFAPPDAPAPRYDLEALRAELGRVAVAEARWGEARRVAAIAEPAAEVTAPEGAPLDVEGFARSRPIPPGPRGLNALPLDAAVLAHSEALADLRIVDSRGRQVPYLVETLGEPLSLDLPPPEPKAVPRGEKGRSRYRIALPYAGLPAGRLVLRTTARVFEREVRLFLPRRGGRGAEDGLSVVAAARWRHSAPEYEAPELVLDVPRLEGAEVALEVDEGENASLPLAAPRLLLPAHRLRFFRAGEEPLRLLYGQRGLRAPRYDLALLAPRLVGAAAHEVSLEPEPEAPPAAVPRQAAVFWGVLGAAVLALVALIARLVRRPAEG